MDKGGEGQEPQNITRRDLVIKGAIAVGSFMAGDAVLNGRQSVPGRVADALVNLADSVASPEVVDRNPIDYGFTQHVFVDPAAHRNQTLELFKAGVDKIAAHGQTTIRFNIWDWEATRGVQNGEVLWNQDNLGRYTDALIHAKERGLKVCVVANTPVDSFKEAPLPEYLTATKQYFQQLAQKYSGLVDTWQLFNEAEIHNFRDYSEVDRGFHDSPEWDRYLGELEQVMAAASEGVKAGDPQAQTAINFAGSWHGADQLRAADQYFDRLSPYVDELQLNYYPYDNEVEIARLPEYIEHYKNRYSDKRVVVGELGVSTGDGRFTPEKQAQYITEALTSLQSGRKTPDGIYLFSLTDRVGERPIEAGYGLLDGFGNPKGNSFEDVASHMQQIKTPQPIPTSA